MYQKMYAVLFNAITEALRFVSEGDTTTAKWLLEEAQRETENIFMEWDWEDGAEPDDSEAPENDGKCQEEFRQCSHKSINNESKIDKS